MAHTRDQGKIGKVYRKSDFIAINEVGSARSKRFKGDSICGRFPPPRGLSKAALRLDTSRDAAMSACMQCVRVLSYVSYMFILLHV